MSMADPPTVSSQQSKTARSIKRRRRLAGALIVFVVLMIWGRLSGVVSAELFGLVLRVMGVSCLWLLYVRYGGDLKLWWRSHHPLNDGKTNWLDRLFIGSGALTDKVDSIVRTVAGSFRLIMAVYGSSLIVGAAVFDYTEDEYSFWDGLWWAIVTSPTLGYGDLFPKTPDGRSYAGLFIVFWSFVIIPLVIANLVNKVLPDPHEFAHEEQLWIFRMLYLIVRQQLWIIQSQQRIAHQLRVDLIGQIGAPPEVDMHDIAGPPQHDAESIAAPTAEAAPAPA